MERARPYVETTNARVIRPATVLALKNYDAYAAPQVAKVQSYAQAQWEKLAAPQLRKAQETAQQVYDENLAVHVQKASEAAAPLYESAIDNAINARENHIIPAIAKTRPHLLKAAQSVQKFLLEKFVPFVHHGSTKVVIFLDGTFWPFVKSIYRNNVQPQLVMIGERIAKYQESRKLHSMVDDIGESSSAALTSTTETATETSTTAVEPSVSMSSATTTTTSEYVPTVSQTVSQPTSQEATDETISADLTKWQKKFAVAADTGVDDLKERIEGIVHTMLKSDMAEGRGLVNALEKTAEVELDTVKEKIKSVVSMLPEKPQSTELDAAEVEVNQAIRQAGSEVRDRAKAIRMWADNFHQALKQRTELASESTAQVLDGIRDLGLQEIGMRWAWMEGVTYKHWQKYHDLKKKFAEWTAEVKEVAVSNSVVFDARSQVDNLFDESMSTTAATAKELIRLRDVAKWKISAGDASDDFDTKSIPIVGAAISAASSLAEDIKDMTSIFAGDSQTSVESYASTASSSVSEASSSASSVMGGVSESVDSVVSGASSAAAALSEKASSVVLGTTKTPGASILEALPDISDASSQASETVTEALSSASSVLLGSSTGSVESLSSRLSDSASSASVKVFSATVPPSEGLLSSASSISDSISSSVLSIKADASSILD